MKENNQYTLLIDESGNCGIKNYQNESSNVETKKKDMPNNRYFILIAVMINNKEGH